MSDSYSTDIITVRSLKFIEEVRNSNRPFFIGIAPIAPHAKSAVVQGSQVQAFTDPVPTKRHADKFPRAKVPRGENFNPDKVRFNPQYRRVVF